MTLVCVTFVIVVALPIEPLLALETELTDPTRPPVIHQSAVQRAQIAEPQEFSVSSIKISDASRRALVNGRLVRRLCVEMVLGIRFLTLKWRLKILQVCLQKRV